jgi:hypothetical protein
VGSHATFRTSYKVCAAIEATLRDVEAALCDTEEDVG